MKAGSNGTGLEGCILILLLSSGLWGGAPSAACIPPRGTAYDAKKRRDTYTTGIAPYDRRARRESRKHDSEKEPAFLLREAATADKAGTGKCTAAAANGVSAQPDATIDWLSVLDKFTGQRVGGWV